MKQLITLDVNGELHELAIHPHETLLGVLRERIGLVGPKRACDTGGCGSCTVHVNGQAVYACMMYALSVQDRKVMTVEGLAQNGRLDPLQEAFIEAGAVQCGYCTSGILMAAKELLKEMPEANDEQIRHGIAGNLCRCTGYQRIVQATKLAAASR
jgi:carbon-monoxide dehydrogenase small subunit